MSALENAIKWKLNYIVEMISATQHNSAVSPAEKTKLIQELNDEKKVLEGKDKVASWHVVRANLIKALEVADRNYHKSTKADDQEFWRKAVEERKMLLSTLQGEGPPIKGS